jgi:hypothetical protein
MTLSLRVLRELYRSAFDSLKVINMDTLYLVFKDRFPILPYPDLDSEDSIWLPLTTISHLRNP